MHEGDPPASGTGAWRVVDEAIAGGPAGGERRLDVRHGDPDMSDPGGSRHAVPPNENDIEVDQPWEK